MAEAGDAVSFSFNMLWLTDQFFTPEELVDTIRNPEPRFRLTDGQPVVSVQYRTFKEGEEDYGTFDVAGLSGIALLDACTKAFTDAEDDFAYLDRVDTEDEGD